MRYSRFRNGVENSKSTKRQPKSSAAASTADTKTSCNRVTKRKSVGARKVADDEDEDSHRDADGDTEDDDDEHHYTTGKGKENRHQQCKTFKTSRAERNVTANLSRYLELDTQRDTQREAKMPKDDPDAMDPHASFSSLPSPPMEAENTMDFMDESPLLGQEPLFPSAAAPAASTRDRLLVLKKRKAAMHSPTMDMEASLHQIPQAPQAQAQSQIRGYGLPGMGGAGLGLSAGASRIHSMPLLHTPQHQHKQDFSSMPGYPGGVMMMRHHSAGSPSGLSGAEMSQAHQTHHIVSSNGALLSHPRTRLLTPSSDDHHQQQQQQQQQHNFLQRHMPALVVDDFLAFDPFSVSAMNQANAIQNPSINDAATPLTQWTTTTTTPFASPALGETLDGTLDATLDMSPYMASGMDFGAAGDGSMDPIMTSIDPGTSLFAMADDAQQQPQNSEQQYMARAFAKHSSGWDVMISHVPHI